MDNRTQETNSSSKMNIIFMKGKSLYSASFNDQNQLVARTLSFPSSLDISPGFQPEILGSCRSLLCFASPDCCFFWNPSTGSHHIMPTMVVPSDSEERSSRGWRLFTVKGLGFDEANGDYKLVLVYQLGPQGFVSVVVVYSLKSDSWRRFVDFPYIFHKNRRINDVFVNGALHFIVSKSKMDISEEGKPDLSCFIAAFDVSKETCALISKLPDDTCTKYIFGSLGVLYGSLCLSRTGADRSVCQILRMRDYGEEESWAFLFLVRTYYLLKPITKLENPDHVLFEAYHKIVRFDTKSLTDVQIKYPDGVNEDEYGEICVCMVLDSVGGDGDDQMQLLQEDADTEEENSATDDQMQLQEDADTEEDKSARDDLMQEQQQQQGDAENEEAKSARDDQMQQQQGEAENAETKSARKGIFLPDLNISCCED